MFFRKVLSECSLKVFQAGTTRSVIKPLHLQLYVHKILLVSYPDFLHGIRDKEAFSYPAIECLKTKQPLCEQATCSESHGNGTPAISVTNSDCGQKHGEAIVSPATYTTFYGYCTTESTNYTSLCTHMVIYEHVCTHDHIRTRTYTVIYVQNTYIHKSHTKTLTRFLTGCTHTHKHTHTCAHTHTNTHTNAHNTHIYTRTTYIRICTCILIPAHNTHMRTDICTHASTLTCTHTYEHTRTV